MRQPAALRICLSLILTLAGAVGCSSPQGHSSSTSERRRDLPGGSLYQVHSTWTADTGQSMKLIALKGRPQVLAMIFTSCQSACPALLHDLKQVEAALSPEDSARVGFVLITIDPARDTVAKLREYRAVQGLNPKRWTLLRGVPDDVLELSVLLGVRFKQDSGGQFAHSNLITVLNAEGEIAVQVSGLHQDSERILQALRSEPSPAVNLR